MHTSIKFRITTWFAAMMVLIEALVLTFIMIINGNVVTKNPEQRLMQVVNANVDRVEFSKQEFRFDDIKYYSRGVYTILYDEQENILRGSAPSAFTAEEPLSANRVRLVSCGAADYYVYDVHVDMFVGGVWLRGIIDAAPTGSFMTAIVAVAWSVLPVLLILSILGGYFIARQALKPIKKVTEAANAINDGQDLKARIGTGESRRKSRDEVENLTAAFDSMFDRLERSFEAEQQFTSDASHELRTPTTVILAECNYAKKNDMTLEDYKASMDVIERQAEKMSTLVRSLLEITRLDQGTQKVSFEYADLSDLVSIVCEEQALVAQHNIRLERDIQSGIFIDMDVFLISRMLQNLIDNAYKFGVEKGWIHVRLIRTSGRALLTVEDNGVGISEEKLEMIWQRFYQGEDSSRSQNGMGLGLAMVRQIVQLHGGTIEVESTLGKGTRFMVTLPEHQGKEETK